MIVGAEPTGLSLAVQLMRCDIDFVITDQKEGVAELSKAIMTKFAIKAGDRIDLYTNCSG